MHRVGILGEALEAAQAAPAARHTVSVRHTRHIDILLELPTQHMNQRQQPTNRRRVHIRLNGPRPLRPIYQTQERREHPRDLELARRLIRREGVGLLELVLALLAARRRLRTWRRRIRLALAATIARRAARFHAISRCVAAALAAAAIAAAAAASASAEAILLLLHARLRLVRHLLDQLVHAAQLHLLRHPKGSQQPQHV